MDEPDNGVLAPPQPPHEFHEDEGPRWPRILGYVLSAVIVALAAVFLGRTIYRSVRHDTSTTHTPVITQPANPTAAKTPSTSGAANSNNNSVSGQLPNNGPGQVIGLFVVSSLAAAGLHFVLSLRRGSRTN